MNQLLTVVLGSNSLPRVQQFIMKNKILSNKGPPPQSVDSIQDEVLKAFLG